MKRIRKVSDTSTAGTSTRAVEEVYRKESTPKRTERRPSHRSDQGALGDEDFRRGDRRNQIKAKCADKRQEGKDLGDEETSEAENNIV